MAISKMDNQSLILLIIIILLIYIKKKMEKEVKDKQRTLLEDPKTAVELVNK